MPKPQSSDQSDQTYRSAPLPRQATLLAAQLEEEIATADATTFGPSEHFTRRLDFLVRRLVGLGLSIDPAVNSPKGLYALYLLLCELRGRGADETTLNTLSTKKSYLPDGQLFSKSGVVTSRDLHGSQRLVWLCDLRSAHNTGAILRTAEFFGFDGAIFSGRTPAPDHPGVIKAAMGAEKMLPVYRRPGEEEIVSELKQAGITLIALEQTPQSVELAGYKPHSSSAEKQCLVLGNEELGLPPAITGRAAVVYTIPGKGRKHSLNVGAAFAVFAARTAGG